ncbi:hypothetical protein ACWGIN_31445 [Streptomyces sp. NPDC054861]
MTAPAPAPSPRPAVGQVDPFGLERVEQFHGVRPGSRLSMPLTIAHRGSAPAPGVSVTIALSGGLEFAKEHANCQYGRIQAPFGLEPGLRDAVCVFEQPLRAGAAYDLGRALDLDVARDGLNERVHVYVDDLDGRRRVVGHAKPGLRPGRGEALTLTDTGRPPRHVKPQMASVFVNVDNRLDYRLSLADRDLRVEIGEEITLRPAFTNDGRGTFRYAPQDYRGPDPHEISLVLPAGLEVVDRGFRWMCRESGSEPQGPFRYVCTRDLRPFTVRVVQAMDGSPGELTMGTGGGTYSWERWDDDLSDNRVRFTVTAVPPGSSAGMWPVVAGCVGAVLLGGVGALLLLRRRRGRPEAALPAADVPPGTANGPDEPEVAPADAAPVEPGPREAVASPARGVRPAWVAGALLLCTVLVAGGLGVRTLLDGSEPAGPFPPARYGLGTGHHIWDTGYIAIPMPGGRLMVDAPKADPANERGMTEVTGHWDGDSAGRGDGSWIAVRGAYGSIRDPERARERTIEAALATPGARLVSKVRTGTETSPDGSGQTTSCARLAFKGTEVSVCAWADTNTRGAVVSYGTTPSTLGLLGEIRYELPPASPPPSPVPGAGAR